MSGNKKIDAPKSEFEEERELLHRQILSSVSHDLKTPLSAMIGSLEIYDMMKDKLSDDKKEGLIKTALQEAYRLDNFVTNILDMAKLENGMIKVRHEDIDLESSLKDCAEKIGHRYKKYNIKIAPFSSAINLNTDPTLFCRIVGVLIDNAIKYGGSEPLVEIEFQKNGSTGVIIVKDSGVGIPEDKIHDIFSKYTRLKIQDHQNAGTGLGLPIGRGLASLLGGTLTAENNKNGKGSTFTFTFPLK